jgi:hypothetical protein
MAILNGIEYYLPPGPSIGEVPADVPMPTQPVSQITNVETDRTKELSAMILGGTLGAALGNFVPDPGDIVYVLGQRWLTEKYQARKISEAQLWGGELAVYYLPSFTYWSLLSLAVFKTEGLKNKIILLLGTVSAGAVISLIANFILKADKKH